MVVVVCADDQLRRKALDVFVQDGIAVQGVPSCMERRHLPDADSRVCVYVTPLLDVHAQRELIAGQAAGVFPPTILVTTTANSLANLGGVRLHGILPLDQLSNLTLLVNAVLTNVSAALHLAAMLVTRSSLDQPLRKLLVETLSTRARIPQRCTALQELDRSGSWLDSALRRAFGDVAQPWNRWVFVARTVRAKDLINLDGVGTSERAARALKVSRRTLMHAVKNVAMVDSFASFCELSTLEVSARAANVLNLRTSVDIHA